MTEDELEIFQGMIDNMKHMLGIDLTRLKKGQKKYDCPRDGFYGNDYYLNIAADLNLVIRVDSGVGVHYHVTQKGFIFFVKIVWNYYLLLEVVMKSYELTDEEYDIIEECLSSFLKFMRRRKELL